MHPIMGLHPGLGLQLGLGLHPAMDPLPGMGLHLGLGLHPRLGLHLGLDLYPARQRIRPQLCVCTQGCVCTPAGGLLVGCRGTGEPQAALEPGELRRAGASCQLQDAQYAQ